MQEIKEMSQLREETSKLYITQITRFQHTRAMNFPFKGCPAAWLHKKIGNRKLRIEKIGKIGNLVLKNRRKIGKSIVLFSTRIDSMHPIRVIIMAMSLQLLRLQDLNQLLPVRKSENDQ